jgi:hypothetical protein
MLLDVLVGSPWLVAMLWGILSLWDFVATMLYSKAYREFLNKTITYEGGLEMNPSFEKDVSELRWLSPRYVLSMLFVAFLLVLGGLWLPQIWFETLAGAALLLVLATDFRHIENLSVVGMLKKHPESMQGRLQQSYALSQRRVAVGTFNTGLLFLIIAVLAERVFFLGGALICGMYALRHYLLANRQLSRPTPVSK